MLSKHWQQPPSTSIQKGKGWITGNSAMLSVPCTHQETKSPAMPQPPFLPAVFSDLLPTETWSKDSVYVALVMDRRKMSPKRFSLRCLGQGCPQLWRARAKGPVGSISPHLTPQEEIPLGQEPAPRGITQLGQEGWRGEEKAPSPFTVPDEKV